MKTNPSTVGFFSNSPADFDTSPAFFRRLQAFCGGLFVFHSRCRGALPPAASSPSCGCTSEATKAATAGFFLSTPVSLLVSCHRRRVGLLVPVPMLPLPFLAAVKPCDALVGFSGLFRRDRATTGHPIHGGRWWWVSIACLDVFQALYH